MLLSCKDLSLIQHSQSISSKLPEQKMCLADLNESGVSHVHCLSWGTVPGTSHVGGRSPHYLSDLLISLLSIIPHPDKGSLPDC